MPRTRATSPPTANEPQTYPLGVVVRLTGLSGDALRAWERRYNAVEPLRTPGGSRRYRESDVRRLRLLKQATERGFPIGDLAGLSDAELERRAGPEPATPEPPIQEVIQALDALDSERADRLIALQLSALGPVRFAAEFAAPLLRLIGSEWSRERLCIAGEHLGSALLRSQLGSALRPTAAALAGPRILFTTPSGEGHEFGALIAALTALGAGAHPVYLGCDVPVEEILIAVEKLEPDAVALSLVTLSKAKSNKAIDELRAGLNGVHLWIGGARAAELDLPEEIGVASLEDLERKVALLRDTSA